MIQSLRTIRRDDSDEYGGKAANLGELIGMGMPVPEGYALSFQFFEEYLRYNQIICPPEQVLESGREMRQRILEGQFSQELSDLFSSSFKDIKEGISFAVRSSSLVEDSEPYSMAGMFESYIGLNTYEQLEEAVKKCYASLYADKVLHFLFENHIPFQQLKMGVIVQQFIEGSPSGVVFTADTIHMDAGRMHINAVDSICADYVGGNLPSSLYVVEKDSGKTIEMNRHETSPLLEQTLLMQLHAAALQCERHFGCFLDIEWTFSGGKVFILQARPITTFKPREFAVSWENPGDDQYTWYCLFPSPCTPLVQDIMRVELEEMSQGAYETLFRLDTYGECTIQDGFVYVRNKDIQNIEEKRELFLRSINQLAEDGKCIFHDCILPELLSHIAVLDQYTGRNLSPAEAAAYLRKAWDYLKLAWRKHWPAVQANENLYRFEQEFLKTFPDMNVQDVYDLVYGFSKLSRERELLFAMSSIVKNNPVLQDMFEQQPYDEILHARLKSEPSANSLLQWVDTYISEFGICDAGVDTVLHPVVRERPDYVIGQLRDILNADGSVFFETMKNAAAIKQKKKEEVLARLSPTDQALFLSKLELAEKAFIMNDNHNYYMERMYRGYVRLASMEAGRILCRQNVLDNPEDIQFLHLAEALSLLEGRAMDTSVIQDRKKEYLNRKKIMPPEVIGVQPDFNGFGGYAGPQDEEARALKRQLAGVSGLRKKVRGTVHVGIPENLTEDRILVLQDTHFEQNILSKLNRIKGFIYNWGSPYDHPAILAREMNIPAIYKTNNATDVLKTGDSVELDGFTGIVTIL